MTALDYILDGLEAELQLERELGRRVVECDRALLSPIAPEAAPPQSAAPEAAPPAVKTPPAPPPPAVPPAPPPVIASPAAPTRRETPSRHPFVFLHDRPLSPKGADMMQKIVDAMHGSAETTPIVVEGPVPDARVYIILGSLALRKWLPGVKGEPGSWVKTPSGADALVTYSPEKIVRFNVVTPVVKQMKVAMWANLKQVMRRIA